MLIGGCRVLGSSLSRVFVTSDPTAINCGVKCKRMSPTLPDLQRSWKEAAGSEPRASGKVGTKEHPFPPSAMDRDTFH